MLLMNKKLVASPGQRISPERQSTLLSEIRLREYPKYEFHQDLHLCSEEAHLVGYMVDAYPDWTPSLYPVIAACWRMPEGELPHSLFVDPCMRKLRQKLFRRFIDIRLIWDLGYQLEERGDETISSLMALRV